MASSKVKFSVASNKEITRILKKPENKTCYEKKNQWIETTQDWHIFELADRDIEQLF